MPFAQPALSVPSVLYADDAVAVVNLAGEDQAAAGIAHELSPIDVFDR